MTATRCGVCSPDVTNAIIAEYADRLRAVGSVLASDENVWAECAQQARHIVAECQRTLHDDCEELPAGQLDAEFASLELGARRAVQHIPARESLRAARILRDVVLDALPGMLAGLSPDEALPRGLAAVRALTRAIDARVTAAEIGYDAFLMRGADLPSVDRGSRLAREVHDRIGSNLGLALRYLELHELEQDRPDDAQDRIDSAKAALLDTFGFVRELVSGLRVPQQGGTGLRSHLMNYAAVTRPAGTEVDIQVSGPVDRLPPLHQDEVFLVLRECLRNSFAHSGAAEVRVRVAVDRHGLEGRVTDDGKGIGAPAAALLRGNGLASMRERIAALGGTLTLSGPSGRGTTVVFRVPLRSTEGALGISA
ncbi:sensor histidine kinase [Streptomyces sp. NPDC085529]|uniref:sensor histidine kinase n=1 Tax=Streptomyces sp. NPDC085529 TaxID=3365729 RepID=UPI0037D26EB9